MSKNSKNKGKNRNNSKQQVSEESSEANTTPWYELDLSVPENLDKVSRKIFSLDSFNYSQNCPYYLEVKGKSTKESKAKQSDDDDAELRKAIEASLADTGGSGIVAISEDDPLLLIKDDPKLPSGIKNQGATCYMNSFLQVLFTIPEFRKALYNWKQPQEKAASSEVSVCKELQTLISELEYTNSKFVNPYELVRALGIDPSVQEDPQEFWSLFLSFIEHEIPDISKLFFGEMQSIVKCGKCGKAKQSPYGFNTVNLNATAPSFEKALDQYMVVEKLENENKYICAKCGVTDNSERVTRIKSLPPYLNFSIMRYEYDFATQTRKKITNPFSFPLTFDFSKFVYPKTKDPQPEYELFAVLEHRGTSAISGHYVCKTVRDGKWYEFNDEVVKPFDMDKEAIKMKTEWGSANKMITTNSKGKKGGPNTKSPTTQTASSKQPKETPSQKSPKPSSSSSSSSSLSSSSSSSSSSSLTKTSSSGLKISEKNKLEDTEESYPRIKSESVYMLTYRRKDLKKVEYEVPVEIISSVLEKNDELDKRVKDAKEAIAQKEREEKEEKDFRTAIIKDARSKSDGEYVWMSLPWWEEFVMSNRRMPVDITGLACRHGFISVQKKDQIKCIKKESWDKLVSFCGGLKDESVPVLKVGEFCRECTDEYCKDTVIQKERDSERDAVIASLGNANRDGLRYYVSKQWINLWKTSPELVSNSDFMADIVCEHGNLLCDKKKRVTIPEDAFNYFKLNYPCSKVFEADTTPCELCSATKDTLKVQRESLAKIRADAKKDFKSLISSGGEVPGKNGSFYVLELEWFNNWVKWLKSNSVKECVPFNNKGLICEHGKFRYNPMPEPGADRGYVLVSDDQYHKLREQFGEDDKILEVTIGYEDGNDPLVSKDVCWDCIFSAADAQAEFFNSYITLCVLEKTEYDSVESALERVRELESPEKAVVSISISDKSGNVSKKYKNTQKSGIKKHKIEGVSHDFVVSGLKMTIEMNYPDVLKNPKGYPVTLIFNGAVMEDEEAPLSSYKVREGSEIYPVLIKPKPTAKSPPKKVAEVDGFSGSVLLSSKKI